MLPLPPLMLQPAGGSFHFDSIGENLLGFLRSRKLLRTKISKGNILAYKSVRRKGRVSEILWKGFLRIAGRKYPACQSGKMASRDGSGSIAAGSTCRS